MPTPRAPKRGGAAYYTPFQTPNRDASALFAKASLFASVARLTPELMLEMPTSRKDHGDAKFVAGVDHFLIALRAARLNDISYS